LQLALLLFERGHAFGNTAQLVRLEKATAAMRFMGEVGRSDFRLVPEVREAILNGRRLQELINEAGVRYVTALKNKEHD
jgi:hypothetical protein